MIQVHATDATGTWSIIEAGDCPVGTARSRTRDTPGDALKATWDPQLVTPVGVGSLKKFVKVRTMDLPGFGKIQTTKSIGDVLDPKKYGGGKVIPDYPHTCHVCGGRMLILFSSVEHEGGECPGPVKKPKIRW